MCHQDTQQNIQIGRQGGTVETNGLPYQDKQRIDYEVNTGRKEANR